MGAKPSVTTASATAPPPISLAATLTTAVAWTAIWVLPLAAIAAWFGRAHVLTEIGIFFSKLFLFVTKYMSYIFKRGNLIFLEVFHTPTNNFTNV
jgi:hypothetical protein